MRSGQSFLASLVGALVVAGPIGGGNARAAGAMRDTMSFETADHGALMSARGWHVTAARTGGWGSFPDDYTYRVVATDDHTYVVGSYRHAQNHGHGAAVVIDWDGVPENGHTPLRPEPGLALAFQVTVFVQPYSKGWDRDGTGHVIWRFGPGSWDPMKGARDHAGPSPTAGAWSAGRGPRVGYRLGYDVEGREIPQPELVAFAPESPAPVIDSPIPHTAGAWHDLRLTVVFGDSPREAKCSLATRQTGADKWVTRQTWQFPIDLRAENAANPTRWNALLVDMPLGQWSRQGYGQPTVEMMDQYDDFRLEVIPAGAQAEAVRAKLFMVDRRDFACTVGAPARVFRDEPIAVSVSVRNVTGGTRSGALLVRVPATALPEIVVASPWSLPDGGRVEHSAVVPGLGRPGTHDINVVLRGEEGHETVIGTRAVEVLPQRHPSQGVNVLRNSSFELDARFSGGPMRQGSEFYLMHAKRGEDRTWTELEDAEGWWSEGPTRAGILVTDAHAHSGRRSLLLQPMAEGNVSVISAFDRTVEPGPVTLSVWVKTEDAEGQIDLDLLSGWRDGTNRGAQVRRNVGLPASTGWRRLSVTAESPGRLQAIARVKAESGTVYVDDAQIEVGGAPSTFNVRPQEWFRLSFPGWGDGALAKWVQGRETAQKLTLFCDSRLPLGGTITVHHGPWNDPRRHLLGETEAGDLEPGRSTSFRLALSALRPDAYVVSADLVDEGVTVAGGASQIDVGVRTGGAASNGMLLSRCAIRFAVAPDFVPARIFGVGNGMLQTGGDWFGGRPIDDYPLARELGLTCARGPYSDDMCYWLAAGGIPTHAMGPRVDHGPPPGSSFVNPAYPSGIDIFNPDGMAFFKQRAQDMGKAFAANPIVVSFQMSNESPYLHHGRLCPSDHADAHFRRWCKDRHGDLGTLNRRWKTGYASWEEVEPIVSARFVEEQKNQPQPEGAAAIDWTGSTGRLSKEVVARMFGSPGRAMDWLRWRTDSALMMYTTFRDQARKHDTKTLYSNNLCWPSFWPQMFMPFTRRMDVTMLDVQYTSGQKRALGTPREMMDILEMAESTSPEKPIWGIEVYVQPQWPAEYVALQNWGLVAHGMTNNLVFGWRPYSDHGTPKGVRAWEKPDAHPMWMLIDSDGTRLPHFEHCMRSAREIHSYHRRFNGLEVKRPPSDIGLYVSPDSGEYVIMESGNKPWGSFWQRTRNELVYTLRMNGIRVDYVDDETLPSKPGRFRTMVVPASYVLSQPSAGKLASFARDGGTLVLAGVSGLRDPWLSEYRNLGGPAWAELDWRAPELTTDFARVAFHEPVSASTPNEPTATETEGTVGGAIDPAVVEGKTFRGVNIGRMADATPVEDAAGATVGWARPWGKGRVIAYGVFPDTYTTTPHPSANITHWIRQVIRLAGLERDGHWVGDAPDTGKGSVGTANPVVEVVVRRKSPDERFVFCLNQGGPGEGLATVPVGDGSWETEDVVTGEPVEALVRRGQWSLRLRLQAWGYRVFRLTRG